MKKNWIFGLLVFGLMSLIPFFHPLSRSSSPKVILMSFDGFSNDSLQKFLKTDFQHKGLGKIKKEGIIANQGLEVTLPSLTATSHISIITGAPPSEHGIVSNTFHKTTNLISKAESGFDTPLDSKAQTLWEWARTQGKTVGIISYPGADAKDERRSGDWGLLYSQSEYSSYFQDFSKTDFQALPHILPEDVFSYSRPLVATLNLRESNHSKNGRGDLDSPDAIKRPFKVLAIDTTNDNAENYNKFLIDTDLDFSQGVFGTIDTLKNPWVGLSFLSDKGILKGSFCKLLYLAPDLSSVKIYVGPLHPTHAYPASFQKLIYEEVGFWPGSPDRFNKEVSEEILLEQAIRFSEFYKTAAMVAAKKQKWDLIITYQPILDELEHQFLMTSPKQFNYSAEKSRYFLELIRQGYLHVNHVIDEMLQEFKDINFVIVSDHGMEPIHSVYYPNRVLKKHGYLTPSSGNDIVLARAFSSGGLSHIYINLKGREPNGVVNSGQFLRICQELKDLFKETEPIAQVYFKEETTKLGLNHPHSGDLILVAKPGYHLADDFSKDEFMEAASFYGQHGYDPKLPSMKGIFAAWGPQVKASPIEFMSYQEVLPFIKELLK